MAKASTRARRGTTAPQWKYPKNVLFKNIPPEQDAKLVAFYIEEPIYFMEQFLWVRHKEKGLMRLKLNAQQLMMYHVFQRMRKQGVPIRVICLKARQVGISTFIEAWIYTMCRLVAGMQAFILAHQDKTASKIYEFFELFNDNLPPELMPKKKRRTTAKFVFDGLDSAIETATAGKTNPTDPSRGYALNMVHCCLASDTPILVDDGRIKMVQHVQPGDRVVTHTGAYATVKWVKGGNHNKPVVAIRSWLAEEVVMTADHPVLTQRGLVEAGSITVSDWVGFSRRKIVTTDRPGLHVNGGYKKIRKSNKGKKNPAGELNYTFEVGFAIGHYLAEGTIVFVKQRSGRVPFSLQYSHDYEVVDHVNRCQLALAPFVTGRGDRKSKTSRTCLTVLSGTELARTIEREFGAKENKRIPDWVFSSNAEFCRGIVVGYLSGDGSEKLGSGDNARMRVTSIRDSLVTQVRDIVAALGVGWGGIRFKAGGVISGRNCQPVWILTYNGDAARQLREWCGWTSPEHSTGGGRDRYFMDDTHVWMKVRYVKEKAATEVWDVCIDHPDHTFHTLHFSRSNTEIPWYSDAEKTLKGILSGTSKGPESMVALESTPEGCENEFYSLWELAVEKMPQVNDDGTEINWYPIFLPWWLHEEYELELTPADIATEHFSLEKLDEREREILALCQPQLIGSTFEQWQRKLKWRRREIAIGCQYNPRTFDQEFPSDPKTCFLASGETIYDLDSIDWFMRNTMKEPIAQGCIRKMERGKPYFVEQPDSDGEYPLKIWEWPREGQRYVCGADAAMGSRQKSQRSQRAKEQQGDGGGDNSAACVLSKDRVQVAEYRKQVIDPEDFAEVLAAIGEYYKGAVLNPEVNNGGGNAAGYAVLRRLKICYPTALIAPWPHWDHKNRVSNSSALGFEANTKGGQIILAAGQRELRRGAGLLKEEDGIVGRVDRDWPRMKIHSADLLSELASYKLRNDGSAGAQKGKHDDLVRAWGTAVLALDCLGPPRSQKDKEEMRRMIEDSPGLSAANRFGRPNWMGAGTGQNSWMMT